MLVYGFDVATNTGAAAWNLDRHESSIQCTTLTTWGKFPAEKAFNLGRLVRGYIKRTGTPDYVVIEAPLAHVARGSSVVPLVSGNLLCGAVMGVLGVYETQFELITPASWREQVYGFGRKKGWATKDWKRHAKEQCAQLGVTANNADEAESVMLCYFGGRKSQQVKMIVGGFA